LRAAAESQGAPVLDLVGLEDQPMPDGALVMCADVSALAEPPPKRSAVVFGDPVHAAGAARHWLGIDGVASIVFASRCYAHATAIKTAGVAMTSSERAIRADPRSAMLELLRALDLPLKAPKVASILHDFDEALCQSLQTAATHGHDRLAEDALAIFQEDGAVRRAWCGRELFRWGDGDGEPPPPSMDITGPPRSLVIGPYTILPAGKWRATASFEIDDEAAKRFFLASFGSGENFSHLETVRLAPGHNEMSVVHDFPAPGPAEFALGVPYGGFHGEVHFAGLSLERAEEAAA
jgi:hypothetical protein